MSVRLMKWVLPLGIATTGLVLWNDLLDAALTIRFLYLTVFGAAIITWLLLTERNRLDQAIGNVISWKNPFAIPLMLWLAATVISLGVAIQRSEGYVEISRILFFILSFLWVALLKQIHHNSPAYISTGFCLLCFWLSSTGLKDFIESTSGVTLQNSYYSMGTMGNRNLLAIMICLCLPFHLMVYCYFKKAIVRILISLNSILGASVILLSGSRVGWLSLSALLFILFILWFARQIQTRTDNKILIKQLSILTVILFTISIPVYFLVNQNQVLKDIMKQRLKSLYSFSYEKNIHTESINERIFIWSNSLQLIKDRPITGVGAGNWKFHYAEKGLPERSQRGHIVFLQPHNDFLWVLSETGLIGGLGFISLFIIAIALNVRSYFKSLDPRPAMAMLSGVLAYTVSSFFDFPKERPLILFTFSVLLAYSLPARENKSFTGKTSIINIFIISYLIVSLLISGTWAIRMHGEWQLKQTASFRQSGNLKKMQRHLDKINPTFFESDLAGTPIDWYRSEIAYYQQDRLAFKHYSEQSIRLNPYQLFNLYNLGSIYYKEGDIKNAIAYWEKAVKIAPRFPDAAINLSAAYYNQKRFAEAATTIAAPDVDFGNAAYANITATVLGKYINLMSDTISNTVVKEQLRALSLDPGRVQQLQKTMAANQLPPRKSALMEALSSARKSNLLSTNQQMELQVYYRLNGL